jgi:hypothetical protein
MSNATLTQFKEAVDEEIKSYEAMEELYKLKQAVLVQGKSDALWDVDAKIVSRMKTIKELDAQRKEIGKYLGSENLSMSEAIAKAQASNDTIAEKLKTQQTTLNILANSISLYERTNMDLIKHGLTMTGKTLNIIVNALLPQSNQYNKDGKNVKNEKIQISSIIEEA